MSYRYPTIKVAGKTRLKHRHVAELHAGRPLLRDEHVHHIDRDKWNADPDNLQILPAAEHAKMHAEQFRVHPTEKECEICGATFTPHKTKRKRAKTCSVTCANALRSKTERATRAAMREAAE